VSKILGLIPTGPDWSFDWNRILSAFPEVAAMRGTPHDPVHHTEGCPLVHTRMVCDAMVSSPLFRDRSAEDRTVAFLTALLHDIAKPLTAAADPTGRVSHPGHSRIGSLMARGILWRHGLNPVLREKVCAAIAYHQVPFWIMERDWHDARRIIVGASLTCGNDLLCIQAEADARGRIAPDVTEMVESVEMHRLAAEELGCFDAPFKYADGTTLRSFMASPQTVDPSYPIPRESSRPTATVMCGLPGSGKSTWLAQNRDGMPIVSLDEIREREGISPDKPQHRVIAIAKEEAKAHLRGRRDFAWDGTNLSRELRDGILGMCRDYGFATRLVVTEATDSEINRRLRDRDRIVPKPVHDRLLRRWEHPMPWEADGHCSGLRAFEISD